MASKNLAIIGAGPKAAAIAARAHALSRVKFEVPSVTIFDPNGIAPAWIGGPYGYTDGDQLLCTLAERDLGFPYHQHTFGPAAAHATHALFSWHAFCVASTNVETVYRNWISRGRRPPLHRHYAAYVEWAIRKSGAHHLQKRVSEVRHDTSGREPQWVVHTSDGATPQFDAVVITGSGPPKKQLPNPRGGAPNTNPRVFNACDFWTRKKEILGLLDAEADPADRKVIVIGAGGSAAAIAASLVKSLPKNPPTQIMIVGKEATIFTRSPGHLEDHLYSDPDMWQHLDRDVRQRFVDRLNAGTVWESVASVLNEAENLSYTCATAEAFETRRPFGPPTTPSPPDLDLIASGDRIPGAVFVDAMGFDTRAFMDLLPAHRAAPELQRPVALDSDLSVNAPFAPYLYLPAQGDLIGPAASNLMALGWVADCVLRRHVTPIP